MLTLSCRMAARLLLTGWPRETLESAGVRALWRQGISGDWPILLVTAEREEDCGGVSQAAHLFAYLLENGVQAEMVILLPPENDYEQPLRAFCDTLLLRPALRALHGRGETDLYLIIGTDMLLSFDKIWRAPDEIARLASLAVCARENEDWDALREKAAQLRETLGARIELVPGDSLTVSSTELRQGGALRCYTPESVADYIEEKHLYGY